MSLSLNYAYLPACSYMSTCCRIYVCLYIYIKHDHPYFCLPGCVISIIDHHYSPNVNHFVSITPRRRGGQKANNRLPRHRGVVGLYPTHAWDENANVGQLCPRDADRHANGIFCRSNNRAGFSISAIGTQAASSAGRHTAEKTELVPALLIEG